jgi:tRNA nucleotidyltransferase/poly(A) polymerase
VTQFYEVGGHIRDEFLGIKSKDIDYVVIADSYAAMVLEIGHRGYEIFLETPEYYTVRARGPKGPADFVWARIEGPYYDSRHPDWVKPGNLLNDLKRRDFRMNTITRTEGGQIIDPFNGRRDIDERIIRCVGRAEDRMKEDPLRMLRAIRFSITKDMSLDPHIIDILYTYDITLKGVSEERIREELYKCFKHNTYLSLSFVRRFPHLFAHIFTKTSLWLEPTMKGR